MGKLSFEDKINLYNDRKSGVSISSLCLKYKILHANVEYLTRLIDKHGYDILRKNRNRKKRTFPGGDFRGEGLSFGTVWTGTA